MEKNGEHPWGDSGQMILFVVFIIIWAGDSFFLHSTTFLAGTVPLYIRLLVLVVAFITAMYLFRSGHDVAHYEQNRESVVTTGAFKYVRHPLYLASIIIYAGLTVATASLLSLVVWVVIVVFHNHIASYEEKLLEEKFGEEYIIYKKKTGKWIPKI